MRSYPRDNADFTLFCGVFLLCCSVKILLAGAEVVLETLSHAPRVFSVLNFMDENEADNIIEDALTMTQEEYRLKVLSMCIVDILICREGC